MPRPVSPPRLYWDTERDTWCILYRGKRTRLGLARGEADAARLAVAQYTVDLSKQTQGEPIERPLSQVPIDDILERYLVRRTDPDPVVRVKKCARPKEAGQRVAKLAGFFGGKPTSYINDTSCEAFAAWVGSPSYARRCLADLQAALTEYRKAGLIRAVVTVTLPPAPEAREDFMTGPEAVAFARMCWTHRDTQQRRVGGKLVMVDGKKRLVGGKLRDIIGRKRPWAHVIKFLAVAIATCSRSARVFKASYRPEPGHPYVDLDAGVLYRRPIGEKKSRKQAPPVRLNDRLVAAMRRWSSDRVVNGSVISGDRYVVQWDGKPADCKGAFAEAMRATMDAAFAADPEKKSMLFRRRDGEPKHLVRHSLRHTGITWLAMDPELTVEQICAFAGITRKVFDSVYAHHHEAAQAAVIKSQARKRHKPKREMEDEEP